MSMVEEFEAKNADVSDEKVITKKAARIFDIIEEEIWSVMLYSYP